MRDIRFRFEQDELVHRLGHTINGAMIESFLETYLANKTQTRQFYFLATNFERTRIKDPRIELLKEPKKEKKTVIEKNYLNEAFFPKERRMRLRNRRAIRRKNLDMIDHFVRELLGELDERRVGIFSEEQALLLLDLLGVNLQLDLFPKNFEFLYHPQFLHADLTREFFGEHNQKNRLEDFYQQLTESQSAHEAPPAPPAELRKFDGDFQFVQSDYFGRVFFEVVYSRIVFDKAKERFFQRKRERKELSERLVRLQLGEILKIFENLLEKMVDGEQLSRNTVVDALHSLEDKVISAREKDNIRGLFLGGQRESLSKRELVDLIIAEKAKTIEQELFAYQMGFFEKYLLENFDAFANRKKQFVSIEGFFELLDQLPKVDVSSRQKFLLWSFFQSAGFVQNSTFLDFVSFVSVVGFYIQQVISKFSDPDFVSLSKESENGNRALTSGLLSRTSLAGLVSDSLEHFRSSLIKNFNFLKFDADLTKKLFRIQVFKRKAEDFEGVFVHLQKLHKINQLFADLLKKFIIH